MLDCFLLRRTQNRMATANSTVRELKRQSRFLSIVLVVIACVSLIMGGSVGCGKSGGATSTGSEPTRPQPGDPSTSPD